MAKFVMICTADFCTRPLQGTWKVNCLLYLCKPTLNDLHNDILKVDNNGIIYGDGDLLTVAYDWFGILTIMSEFNIKGLCAAVVTPFHDNGDLNLSLIKPYVDILLEQGVKSIYHSLYGWVCTVLQYDQQTYFSDRITEEQLQHLFSLRKDSLVGGTGGEGLSMTLEERKQLAEKWIEEGKDKLDAIVLHITCATMRETLQLAKDAEQFGVSAIALCPPLFFRPKNMVQLVDYVQSVGEAAPNLPLYFYHSTAYKGGYLSMAEFFTAAQGKIPTLRGVKFEEPNIYAFGDLNERFGNQYQMCIGHEAVFLPSLAVIIGEAAVVGGICNYAGKPMNRILEAYKTGDMETAQKDFFKVLALFRVMTKNKDLDMATQVIKYIMVLSGLDVGPCRSPVPLLTDEQKDTIKTDLTEMGFFDWIQS